MLPSRFHHPHQHADAAHLGRRSTDWGKVVDSMVLSTETLCNTTITQIKQIVNTEFTGVNGPTKEFRGECPVQVGPFKLARLTWPCGSLSLRHVACRRFLAYGWQNWHGQVHSEGVLRTTRRLSYLPSGPPCHICLYRFVCVYI